MTTIASLAVEIGANISGLTRGLNQADKKVNNFIGGMGRDLQSIGRSLTGLGTQFTALTAPIGIALGAGLSVASRFDDSLKELSARTGLVGDDLMEMRDAALDFGEKTSFSAQQAIDGMLQLATSGWTAQEAIAGLPAIMDAAAAGGVELGYASDAITDIMSAFNLADPADAERVANALVRASGVSSADFTGLTEGIANVGGVAALYGLSIEETAATLAVFSEAGIKGAEAGTQLKSMLMKLGSPEAQKAMEKLGVAFYDLEGNVRPLDSVIDDLKISLEKLPVSEQNRLMQELAGSYGIVGLTALLSSGGIDTMLGAMDGATGAADVAAARMDTFSGRVDALKGSLETLAIKTLTPFMNNILKPMAERITEIVNQIIQWTDANPELTSQIVAVAAAALVIGPALVVAGIGIQAMGVAIGALGAVIALATSPFFLLAAGLLAIGAGLAYIWTQDVGGIRTKIEEIANIISGTDFKGAAEDFKSNIETEVNAALTQFQIDADSLKSRVFTQIDQSFLNITGLDFSDLVGSVRNDINRLDWSSISSEIEGKISAAFLDIQGVTVDTTGIEAWANDNMTAILNTVVTVAGIVLGGPIGMTIGAAKLISTAIENDFLGIGTFLKDSGIQASVETAFNTLKADIGAVLSGVFAPNDPILTRDMIERGVGGGTGGGAMSGPLATLISDLRMGADWFSKELPKITAPITDGLSALFDGIGGFIENLQGTETEGLIRIVTVVGGVLGVLLTKIAEVGAGLVGDVLTNIGAALPQIGSFISDFVTTLSRIGEGDWSGAAQSLADSVGHLVSAGLNLIGLDIDFASWGESLAGWVTAFESAWSGITFIADSIRHAITRFFLDIQIEFAKWVGDFRQKLLDVSGGRLDIAPTVDLQLAGLMEQRGGFDIADEIQQELAAGLSAGSIDLSEPLAGAIAWNPAAIAAGMSTNGRAAVQSALSLALSTGDTEAYNVLLPLATELGIDIASLNEQFQTGVTAAAALDYSAAVNVDVTLNPAFTNLTAFGQSITNAAQAASGTGANIPSPIAVPAFADGGLMPHTGLALLHAGERVLNPQETRAYDSGRGGNIIHINGVQNVDALLSELYRRGIALQ